MLCKCSGKYIDIYFYFENNMSHCLNSGFLNHLIKLAMINGRKNYVISPLKQAQLFISKNNDSICRQGFFHPMKLYH